MTADHDLTTFETWRRKAEEDLTAASILAEHDGPPATICFLCQQVAEKYLKAFLWFRKRPAKRIHHLDMLLEDCIALEASFHRLVDDAVLLKRYYIESRYPDDLPTDVRPEESRRGVDGSGAHTHLRAGSSGIAEHSGLHTKKPPA